MEKKETTTGCTSSLPDSDGTGVPTSSDGVRDSDDVCGCDCFSNLTDEEIAAIDIKTLLPYVSNEWVRKNILQ